MKNGVTVLALAAGCLLAGTGGAGAVIVIPQIGTVATEAHVGNGGIYYTDPTYPLGFHSTGGLGEPGYPATPNYSPKAYFGTLQSASSGYDRESSSDGRNQALATGSAAIDLYSGQMHLVANGDQIGSSVNSTARAFIAAGAAMSDVITVTGTITHPTTVRLNLVIDGGITGTADDYANTIAAFEVSSGGVNDSEVFIDQFVGGQVQVQDRSGSNGHLTVGSASASALALTLSVNYTVTDTSRLIPFLAIGQVQLDPNTPGTISGDFGSTARLVLDLPDGLGFTSQSGVLLTVPQDADGSGGSTTVPEPATAPLLLGVLTLPAAMRCRRRLYARP